MSFIRFFIRMPPQREVEWGVLTPFSGKAWPRTHKELSWYHINISYSKDFLHKDTKQDKTWNQSTMEGKSKLLQRQEIKIWADSYFWTYTGRYEFQKPFSNPPLYWIFQSIRLSPSREDERYTFNLWKTLRNIRCYHDNISVYKVYGAFNWWRY